MTAKSGKSPLSLLFADKEMQAAICKVLRDGSNVPDNWLDPAANEKALAVTLLEMSRDTPLNGFITALCRGAAASTNKPVPSVKASGSKSIAAKGKNITLPEDTSNPKPGKSVSHSSSLKNAEYDPSHWASIDEDMSEEYRVEPPVVDTNDFRQILVARMEKRKLPRVNIEERMRHLHVFAMPIDGGMGLIARQLLAALADNPLAFQFTPTMFPAISQEVALPPIAGADSGAREARTDEKSPNKLHGGDCYLCVLYRRQVTPTNKGYHPRGDLDLFYLSVEHIIWHHCRSIDEGVAAHNAFLTFGLLQPWKPIG